MLSTSNSSFTGGEEVNVGGAVGGAVLRSRKEAMYTIQLSQSSIVVGYTTLNSALDALIGFFCPNRKRAIQSPTHS